MLVLEGLVGLHRAVFIEDLLVGLHSSASSTYDTLSLTKEARIYNGLKTISLTSGAGKSGQPLVKE